MRRFAVVLVEPVEAGNVGSVARVMKNFGVRDLILVSPRCEPLDGMARAMSAGATEILRAAKVVTSLADAVAPFALTIALTGVAGRHRTLECIESNPVNLLKPCRADARVALVFGREDKGFTNEEANSCGARWRIPTMAEFPSLNLAQSVAIALFATAEAHRQLGLPAPEPEGDFSTRALHPTASDDSHDAAATQAEVSRMLDHLREAMIASGFEESPRTDRSITILRSLLGRAQPAHREVQVIRGIIRQMMNRLKRG